jgi:K+-sensing histidine kinase KdpD
MKQTRFSLTLRYLRNSMLAVLLVAATTIPMFLIGRDTLGEAVIALVYLVPVTWAANRWGQLPGICAALTAALAFNFLFIPPFYTFAIGRLEGWLLLAIFLGVAIIVVERIQASLSQAREAVFMYEMSAAISNLRTPEAIAYSIARQVQQLFQASQVNVIFHPDKNSPAIAVSAPDNEQSTGRPDRLLPIINSWGFVGEIQIWRGVTLELPAVESRLFQNFAQQAGRAFERTHPFEPGKNGNGALSKVSIK